MVPVNELFLFAVAAFMLVISPGPNMIYLISRSITQGRTAGLISLTGVVCGFLFHIIMVSFGLTAILFAVPYAYLILKTFGVLYLLYLAYQAIKPNSKSIFEIRDDLKPASTARLFSMGLFTNVLNPKWLFFIYHFSLSS